MIQCTICLIGIASEFISQIRRTRILAKLDAFWSNSGQENFSDFKDNLFRGKFQQTLASKVEKEAVLAKVVVASKPSKENRGKETSSIHGREGYGRSQFFCGSPSARYGGKQGNHTTLKEGKWLPSGEILLKHSKAYPVTVSQAETSIAAGPSNKPV